MMKPCTICGIDKPIDQFSPSRKGLYGCVSRCKPCRAQHNADYRAANPDRIASANARQYYKNHDANVARARAWNDANPERHRANMRRYMARHPERQHARMTEWLKENLRRKLARNYARAKRVQQATPPWVDRRAIATFYLNCPPGHEVDHIWPIRGANSCGLHVLWNLQYLPKLDNRTKFNREPTERRNIPGLRQRAL